MRCQIFVSYLTPHLCFLRITWYLLRLCDYKCGNHGDLATSPNAACGHPVPVLDYSPPSTPLGQCRMCMVSQKLRGKCLIYLPFTMAITKKNTHAVGLLLNLETAQRGRSVLLSDEQNLLLKKGKRGLQEHQNGFYKLLTKPRMKAI